MIGRWEIGAGLLIGLALTIVVWLVFMVSALHTLESRLRSLEKGQSVEETDDTMGFLFHAETIRWEDIPTTWTEHMDKNACATVRDYSFLGLDGLNIPVLYDAEGRSYSWIPCYE